MSSESFVDHVLRFSFEKNMVASNLSIVRSSSPEIIGCIRSNDYENMLTSVAWNEWQKSAYIVLSWANFLIDVNAKVKS